MFKQDDYIVCLNTPSYDPHYPCNFIFKQRETEYYLSTYLDAEGDKNGWSKITFDDTGEHSEWRYATLEEIEEYERLGKPYDVTTLVSTKPNDTSYLIEFFAKNDIT